MVLTHIDLKYVSLIYRKIHQKVPNGKGLNMQQVYPILHDFLRDPTPYFRRFTKTVDNRKVQKILKCILKLRQQ